VLLLGGQVMLSKGAQDRVAREFKNSLVNTDCANFACVVGTQISEYIVRKDVSRIEKGANGINDLISASTRQRHNDRAIQH
jgi:hypothetical protein